MGNCSVIVKMTQLSSSTRGTTVFADDFADFAKGLRRVNESPIAVETLTRRARLDAASNMGDDWSRTRHSPIRDIAWDDVALTRQRQQLSIDL